MRILAYSEIESTIAGSYAPRGGDRVREAHVPCRGVPPEWNLGSRGRHRGRSATSRSCDFWENWVSGPQFSGVTLRMARFPGANRHEVLASGVVFTGDNMHHHPVRGASAERSDLAPGFGFNVLPLPSQFPEQPSFGHFPVAQNRLLRDLEHLSGFYNVQATKIP